MAGEWVDGAVTSTAYLLDVLRGDGETAGMDLDATLAWARARADQILAELSPDSDLLQLLRGDDRVLPPTVARRRTLLGVPAMVQAPPPREATRSSQPQRVDPEPASLEPTAPAPSRVALPQPTADDTQRALAEIARMVGSEPGTGPTVLLDLPASDLAPPDPQAHDGTTVRTVGASPFARFLPDPPPTPASPPEAASSVSPAQRRHPRYELHQPVLIRHEAWDELVQMATNDISRGGMFVATEHSPPLRETVHVQVELPDGAGKLTLEGEVVHVVAAQPGGGGPTPGFGLQFATLTPERKERLHQLVEYARRMQGDPCATAQTLGELGLASSAAGTRLRLSLSEVERHQLRELTADLATMRERSDDELLGVDAPTDVEQVHAAFDSIATRWRAMTEDATELPELRTLAAEIVQLLQGARDRVAEAAVRRADARAKAFEAARQRQTEAAREAEVETTSAAIPSDHIERPPLTAETAGVRRSPTPKASFVQRLLHRSGKLAERLDTPTSTPPTETPAPAPSPRGRVAFNKLVGDGFEHLSAKRYDEAIEAFERAVQARPDSAKARILLLFSEARKLVRDKQLDQARRKYEEVLEIDPENATAQRDVVMLSCLM